MATDGQVQFGIAIPQMFAGSRADLARLRTFLPRAEALGFESLWVQEQIVGRGLACLEPAVLLGYAASLTEKVRLGSAVFVTVLRNPLQLAKALATLDQLSGGRLIVGVGLGANTRIYPAFGLEPGRRVRRFVEGLVLMKQLWTEERVTFEGEFWKLEGTSMQPKPVQKPHPPVWFGGGEPAALKRGVLLGDGWMGAGSSSVDGFRERVGLIRQYLAEAKRDPSTFPVSKRVYLAVDEDRQRAHTRLREWFTRYYGSADLADRVALYGSPEEVIAGLREIRSAGAGLILLNPVFDELRHLERLAGEVMPAVG